MPDPEMLYRIALTLLQDVGSITGKKLVAYAGSARAVFHEKYANLVRIPGIGSYLARRISTSKVLSEAEKELEYIERHGIVPLYFLDEGYPERLKHCIDGPLILYLKGDNCLSGNKMLSIVGTRDASENGRSICREIIGDLAIKYPDLIIVSGLAYGIDIAAHNGALQNRLKTIAVLGHGLSTIYPSAHRKTAIKIVDQGGLVTDFSSGTGPERNNFIRRNRIIAGLSEATLVIESGLKGGALITADIASSYNREVFAVPGRPSDERSRGCNMMIKKNLATLVENSEDIEYELDWIPDQGKTTEQLLELPSFTEEERMIVESLQKNPELLPETISSRTGLPIHRVISLLVEMELRGWLIPLPGNIYRLKIKPL